MNKNKLKWRRIRTRTVTFDQPILEAIARRVFLTTTENILDLQFKGDKVKIRGYRGLIEHAFRDRKIFQKIIDKQKFKKRILEYVKKDLLDEKLW